MDGHNRTSRLRLRYPGRGSLPTRPLPYGARKYATLMCSHACPRPPHHAHRQTLCHRELEERQRVGSIETFARVVAPRRVTTSPARYVDRLRSDFPVPAARERKDVVSDPGSRDSRRSAIHTLSNVCPQHRLRQIVNFRCINGSVRMVGCTSG